VITNPNPIDGMTDVRGRANITTPQTKQASGSKSRPADGDIAPTVGWGHLAPSPHSQPHRAASNQPCFNYASATAVVVDARASAGDHLSSH